MLLNWDSSVHHGTGVNDPHCFWGWWIHGPVGWGCNAFSGGLGISLMQKSHSKLMWGWQLWRNYFFFSICWTWLQVKICGYCKLVSHLFDRFTQGSVSLAESFESYWDPAYTAHLLMNCANRVTMSVVYSQRRQKSCFWIISQYPVSNSY